MRRLAVIAVVSAGLVGCGHSTAPRLQSADATRLIALTRKIAAEDACGQSRDIPKLRTQAIALVNEHRVPAALQEPLLGGVQALAEQTPLCLPSVPVAATPKPPAPAPHPKPPAHFVWPFRPGHGHHHPHGPGHGPK
jgi:hypothetical protein